MTNKTLINLKNDLVFGDVVPDEKILQHASNLVVYEKELLDQDLLKCVDHHDIITSVNDNRLYRGLEFPHQLKVVLITDPSAEKAAAALRVAAGYSLDPNTKPGLAYLFQRVLYLTDEGQQQKLFKDFVRENGGTVNAETYMHYATYNFDINPNKFSEAFIQFAEFFTKFPDLSENVIQKEYPNIKLEIEKNKLNENMNIIKFFKWIRYNEIDIKKQEKRLSDIIEKEKTASLGKKELLQLFYIKYYNACTMQLCILGRESLDELENMVTSTFYRTKQNTIPAAPPVTRNTSVYKICFTPQDESNKLILLFEYSSFYHQVNASHLLDYAFKYDGKDSLLSALKIKGWVNSITPGRVDSEELYSITFDLTKEGIKHVDNIIILFFKYTNVLRDHESKLKRMYIDYKNIASLKFRLAKKEASLKYVTNIVAETYGILKYVLQDKYFPNKWYKGTMLAAFHTFIRPYRMSLYVTSKEFKAKTTKDFGNYKYTIEKVSEKTCTKWIEPYHTEESLLHCFGELPEPLYDVELNVPPVNLFIPTMISVKPHDQYKDKFPTLIHDTPLLNLWHKKDDKFNEPNAIMILNINCVRAYVNKIDANFTNLYTQILNDSLSEYKFPAAMVNLFWELETNGNTGIKLKIYGFDNKQHVLLEKIFDRIVNFNIKKPTFESHKDIHAKYCNEKIKEFQRDKLHLQAESYLPLLLTFLKWDDVDVLKAHEHVNYEIFCNFASSVPNWVHMEGLIHGNVTKDEAQYIARIIEDKFAHADPYPSWLQVNIHRDIKLEDNTHFMFYKNSETIHSSSTLILYQIKRQTIKEDVLLDFIREMINIPCCNKLKEKYADLKVYTGVYRLNATQNLKILVEGENYIKDIEGNMEDNIEEQVEEFMLSMKDYINNMFRIGMPIEEIEAIKMSITESYHNKKPKTLDDLSNVYWDEITKMECIFNRTDVVLDILKAITLTDLSDFFENLVSKNTPKLSVHVSFDAAPTWYMNKSVYTSKRTSKSKRTIKHANDMLYFYQTQGSYPVKKISIN